MTVRGKNVRITTVLADHAPTAMDPAIGIPAVRLRTVAATSTAGARANSVLRPVRMASAPAMTADPGRGVRRDLGTATVPTKARVTCMALPTAGRTTGLPLADLATSTARPTGDRNRDLRRAAKRVRVRRAVRGRRKGRGIRSDPVAGRRWDRPPSPTSSADLILLALAVRKVPDSADRRTFGAAPTWSGD